MIRGAEQAFKFTTSFDFQDICKIEVVWSQPHNSGSASAPMPIRKYYNRLLESNTPAESRNDGFAPVNGDSKSFVIMLSGEETMRFHEQFKGRVQAAVYCDKVNRTEKSKIQYFTVYPTMTDEIFSIIPSSPTDIIHILDAGEILTE